MSITEISAKIKDIKNWAQSEQGKAIAIVLVIILSSGLSFGLGRLSVIENSQGVKILLPDGKVLGTQTNLKNAVNSQNETINQSSGVHEFANSTQSGAGEATLQSGQFVASKRGKKYYPVDCSAGKNLSEANKIYFQTESEAQSKGYTKSSSCN